MRDMVSALQNATVWTDVIDQFMEKIPPLAAGIYPISLTKVEDAIKTFKPDALYISMFSTAGIDVANKHGLPYAVGVAVLQGGWFDYHDCNACPDSFLWTGVEESAGLEARFNKINRMFRMITRGIAKGAGATENAVRVANGIAPYDGKLGNHCGAMDSFNRLCILSVDL
jgi:hypothetical protein